MKEWLFEKVRVVVFGGDFEKGIKIQDVVDYNKYYCKFGIDISNGGNIGFLDDWYSDCWFVDQQFIGVNFIIIIKVLLVWIVDFIKVVKDGGYNKWLDFFVKVDKFFLFVQDGSYFCKVFGILNLEQVFYYKQFGSDDNWCVGVVILF